MAHFSFLLALAVNGLVISDGHDQPKIEMPQLIEEYLMDPFLTEPTAELSDKCKSFLLQTLFEQRMESLAAANGSEDAMLLSEIEILKSEGFSDSELKRAKQQFIHQMDCFTDKIPSAALLFPEAPAVMAACRNCVEKMQLADLSLHLAAFLNEDPYALRFVYPTLLKNREFDQEAHWLGIYPEPLHSGRFFEGTQDMAWRFVDNPIDGEPLFFINSPSGHIEPFYQLPLDEKEQKLIHELIKTIAEKNVWGLLFKKKEVEKLGKRVNHVHPMRFMGHILADHKLRKWLKDIRHSVFKWDHFIDGFADRMKEEHAKNNLVHYVPGMAHLLHADPNHIMSYIENRDYAGLVKSFL